MAIIRIALKTKSDTIHLEYGCLSDNPDFAEACAPWHRVHWTVA